MPRHPDIHTEVMPDENMIRVNFDSTTDDYHIYELAEWMGRVPGIISARPELGSLALRAANPPFPLDACRAEAHAVADIYFDHPEEKDKAIESKSLNFAWSKELIQVFSENGPPGTLHAERYPNREFDPVDLFIVTNSQVPEENYEELTDTVTFFKKRIHSVSVVDNGYGLDMRISGFFVGYDPKDEVADKVISILSYHKDLFRMVLPGNIKTVA
jgi:hypothetical protein